MLVLSRRKGESLRIGDDTKVTDLFVGRAQIELCVNGSEFITTCLQESVSISDDIKIKVVKIISNHVKIGIDAPNMNVKRE